MASSISYVQPLLNPIPSLAWTWNIIQSISRQPKQKYQTNVRSKSHSSTAATLSSQPVSSNCSSPTVTPELFQTVCRVLEIDHLPSDVALSKLVLSDRRLFHHARNSKDRINGLSSLGDTSSATFFENCYGFPEHVIASRPSSLTSSAVANKLLEMSIDIKLNQLLSRGSRSISVPARFRPSSVQRQWIASLHGLGQGVVLHGRGRDMFCSQVRGFKTPRSGSSGLGPDRKRSDGDDGVGPMLNDLRGTSIFDRFTSGLVAAPPKTDKLKAMLSSSDLSPEIQDKLKIAFAEGYAANDSGRASAGAGSMGRRILRILGFGLAFWLVFQIASTYTALGGNMKINVLKGEKFEVNPEEIGVTFEDVKGVDEAKQELSDIVDYLRNPDKFKTLGAKLPKGVLLVGPPGIGKSLLARAVAGEAGVPFFHASGSEFDEVFVGTGAKRVRQLFDAAKARAPCIVFIDEIDTVGAKRTSSQIHPYANQTINQLLSEMDGFQQNEGIIVLGATNRRDNLDKALLRPGRFDVEVRVFPPDLKGRKDIIEHYMSKIKIDASIDIDKMARGTTGCTGADLENMVNQAALKAAMDGDPAVTMVHMEYARDKVLMGPAKKTKIPDDETNQITAYHEAGHTLVAYYTRDATPLNKVTIIPRGMSLGHTSFMPDKEEYNLTRAQLLARMDVAMGGRVAEEMIYGAEKVTTGASSDFQSATAIATAMVKRWGMSDRVGVRVFQEEDIDTGLSFVKLNEVGPVVTDMVDSEIRRLLSESYERARAILKSHSAEHQRLAIALLKHETLTADDIKAVVEGKLIITS